MGRAGQRDRGGTARDPSEELRVLVARRIRERTGLDVRIKDLSYEVLRSTFRARDIEAGPAGAPLLRLPRLVVGLSLWSKSQGTTVQLVDARGAELRLPVGLLRGPSRWPGNQHASVREGRLAGGRVTILGEAGGPVLVADGLAIRIAELEAPPARAGGFPALSGRVTIEAARLEVAGEVFTGLRAEAELAGERLLVKRLEAQAGSGSVVLSGNVVIGGKRAGGLAFSGTVDLRLDEMRLRGPVKLSGRSLSLLTLSGTLKGEAGRLRPRSGGAPGILPVKLRLRLGGRHLAGTASSWRLR